MFATDSSSAEGDATVTDPAIEVEATAPVVETPIAGKDDKAPEKPSGSDEQQGESSRDQLLKAIKRAVEPVTDAGTPPDPKAKEGKDSAVAADKPVAETPEAQAEAEKSVPFHQHPRWKQVLKERDDLRSQVEAVTRDAEPFKKDSKDYREITGFMEKHGLTTEEASQGFIIMALLKNDPAKAWEQLAPIVSNLRQFTGEELPADLKKKVEDGFIDEATAKETARLRQKATFDAGKTQERQRADQASTQRGDVQRIAASNAAAVTAWETETKGKDPDYARIADFVNDGVKVLIAQHGMPLTSEQAVQMVNKAYTNVKARVGKLIPAKTAIAAGPSSSSSTNGATPQPKTLAEAVRLGAAKSV